MKRLCVLGGGSWGTALAIVLSPRFDVIRLWVRREELAADIQSSRENLPYLPGFSVPPNVEVTGSLHTAISDSDLLVSVLPSKGVRAVFTQLRGVNVPILSATKGLEKGTLLRMSAVIAAASNSTRVAILSGPSFAREVAAGLPTAIVVASSDIELGAAIQAALSGSSFRVYTSKDPIGVELGGAYKNVVAIGAGICHGLKLGHNAIAALITRGLAEMTRLAVQIGGHPHTLAGLAGLGDLVLTCTGDLSRNRSLGEQLSAGKCLADILKDTRMVAEGVETTRSLVELGLRYGVDLPIASQMDAVLHQGRAPRDAIRMLMERALRNE